MGFIENGTLNRKPVWLKIRKNQEQSKFFKTHNLQELAQKSII